GGEARSIVLEGAIKTGKDGRADLALGNQFRDNLVQQPNFKKICGEKANIRYPNVAGTSGGNSSRSGDSSAATGTETSFVFTCGRQQQEGGR
ncbi:hypothetical protein, partial [Candidatus Avelusimicrobium stercoris]|uniref:hypothetical protein n=1 Tax=Candidatus Avelusimicrobium stercoris TaxID=1947924 RepID=UPI003D110C2B